MGQKQSIGSWFKKLGRKALSLALDGAALVMILGACGYLVVRAPEMHRQWLRHSVGERVYMIKGKMDGGGGTGFAFKAKSGVTYTVTNAHVCEGALTQSEDKTSLLVVKGNGIAIPRKILEISDSTDLCILEGMPGVDGLETGSAPGAGQQLNAIGHPLLRPLTVSQGDVIAKQDMSIPDYIIQSQEQEAACNKPKNEIKDLDLEFFGQPIHLRVCFTTIKGVYQTTARVLPGNSGSPVVDWKGDVVAVVFAMDQAGWGYFVSNEDLKTFLSKY